jgi:DNA-binding transcriptional LysR family regulator
VFIMDRLIAMKVFVAVAETSGFAGAARQLLMSPPAVTRAVANLEEEIGTRLFVRTTRSVKLTEAGLRYLDDCRRILIEIDEAEAAAAGSYATPTGTLAVTASVRFGELYVLPILTEYLDRHPTVSVRTTFVDRVVNIAEEGIDVAVRIGHLPNSGLHAVPVGSVRRVLCATPAYLERAGVPQTPADLARHNVIASVGAWNSMEWQFGRDSKSSVNIRPRLFCNTNNSAISAALSNWGLTRVLSYQIASEVEDGQLRIVLPEFEEEPLPIHLVYAEGRRMSAKVRAFIDLAAERLRASRFIRLRPVDNT